MKRKTLLCFLLTGFIFCQTISAQSSTDNNKAIQIQPVKPVDNSGSIAPVKPLKVVPKQVDNSGSVAPVQPVKTAVQPIDESGSVAPVTISKVKAQQPAAPVNTENSTNTGIKVVPVQKKAAYANGSTSLSPVTAQPVEVQPAQPLEITATPVSASSASIVTQLATPAVAGNTAPVEIKATTSTAHMPVIQNDQQLKAQPVEEIKPSVSPVAPQKPVVPMQTSEKTKTKG